MASLRSISSRRRPSWPSDHDPDTKALRFTLPHPRGGALDIAIGKHAGETVYRIEPVDGTLKITDQLLDWGAGFIWPEAAGQNFGQSRE